MENQNNLNLVSLIKDFAKSLKGKLVIGLACLALLLILVLVITNILRGINKQKNIGQNPPIQQEFFTPQPASKKGFSDNVLKPEIDSTKQITVQLNSLSANATPSASFQLRLTSNKAIGDFNYTIKAKNSPEINGLSLQEIVERNYKTITGQDLSAGIESNKIKLVPVLLYKTGEKTGTTILGYEYYTPIISSSQKTIIEFGYAGYHFILSFKDSSKQSVN